MVLFYKRSFRKITKLIKNPENKASDNKEFILIYNTKALFITFKDRLFY